MENLFSEVVEITYHNKAYEIKKVRIFILYQENQRDSILTNEILRVANILSGLYGEEILGIDNIRSIRVSPWNKKTT